MNFSTLIQLITAFFALHFLNKPLKWILEEYISNTHCARFNIPISFPIPFNLILHVPILKISHQIWKEMILILKILKTGYNFNWIFLEFYMLRDVQKENITFCLRWRLVLFGRITCLFISSKCEHRSGVCLLDHNMKPAGAECTISRFASASDIYQKKISSHSSSKQSLFQCKICKKFDKTKHSNPGPPKVPD